MLTIEESYSPSHSFRRPRPCAGESISQWLERWTFERFITLATNDDFTYGGPKGPALMRRQLRNWDARMNRKIVGPKWASRPEDRIWAFYFLEKPHSNPHWHGLISFFPPWPDCKETQEFRFDLWAADYWRQLVPSGTVDIQKITNQRGVTEYVAKSLGYEVSYNNFVLPDEL